MNAIRKKVAETIHVAISEMTPSERGELHDWAERVIEIRNDPNLKKTEKLVQLRHISKNKSLFTLLKKLVATIRVQIWDDQSWARRLGLLGVTGAIATVGSQGAGLALMGSAHAIPLFVLSGIGGVFLGVVIDETAKEVKKRKKNDQ